MSLVLATGVLMVVIVLRLLIDQLHALIPVFLVPGRFCRFPFSFIIMARSVVELVTAGSPLTVSQCRLHTA